jgi:hypothetical protein
MDSHEINKRRDMLRENMTRMHRFERYRSPRGPVRDCDPELVAETATTLADFSDFEEYTALSEKMQRIRSSVGTGLRETGHTLSATNFYLFLRYLELSVTREMSLLRDALFEKLAVAPEKVQVYAMTKINGTIDRLVARDYLELELVQAMLIPEMLEILDVAPTIIVRNYLKTVRYSRRVLHDILLRYFEFEDFLAEHKQLRKDRLESMRKYVTDVRPFENRPWVSPKMLSEALVSGAQLSVLDGNQDS